MESLASERFKTFWSQVAPLYLGQKVAVIGSEDPNNFSCLPNKHLCHFISNLKDSLREAKKSGFVISTTLDMSFLIR